MERKLPNDGKKTTWRWKENYLAMERKLPSEWYLVMERKLPSDGKKNYLAMERKLPSDGEKTT